MVSHGVTSWEDRQKGALKLRPAERSPVSAHRTRGYTDEQSAYGRILA
jgi:hypothetical protein